MRQVLFAANTASRGPRFVMYPRAPARNAGIESTTRMRLLFIPEPVSTSHCRLVVQRPCPRKFTCTLDSYIEAHRARQGGILPPENCRGTCHPILTVPPPPAFRAVHVQLPTDAPEPPPTQSLTPSWSCLTAAHPRSTPSLPSHQLTPRPSPAHDRVTGSLCELPILFQINVIERSDRHSGSRRLGGKSLEPRTG